MQANIYHFMHLSAQYMVLGSISCVLKCGHRCSSSLRMLCEMFGINLLGCASQLHVLICGRNMKPSSFHFVRTNVPHSFALEFSKQGLCNHPDSSPQVPLIEEFMFKISGWETSPSSFLLSAGDYLLLGFLGVACVLWSFGRQNLHKDRNDWQYILEMSSFEQGLKKYWRNTTATVFMLLLTIKMCMRCKNYDFYNLQHP